jgi:hypothetical protein
MVDNQRSSSLRTVGPGEQWTSPVRRAMLKVNSTVTIDDTIERKSLSGDAPKVSISEDEFGLQTIVAAVSDTVLERIQSDGYVIGIQGKWGSGKSTLVNFVDEQIRRRGQHHPVLRFDPWLVGDKGAVLSFFLGQFATAIDSFEAANRAWWRLDYWILRRLGRTLSSKVRKYGQYAATLAKPADLFAHNDPTGTTALAAAGLKTVGWLAHLYDPSAAKSLEALKLTIAKELRRMKKRYPDLRFTVIVDDTDRLDPSEAAEIMRLVRKSADFPFVSYIVCFDLDVLSHQMEVALNVKNGREYIEKIFQTIVSMPPQEPFALRRYLRKLLNATFANEMRYLISSGDYAYRDHIVLDVWAGQLLSTPRDVQRLYEAMKFGWTNLPRECDFLDFVWLQMIKLKSHDLFDWLQRYLTNVGAYRDGGKADELAIKEEGGRLHKIMQSLGWGDSALHSGLTELVPGLKSYTFGSSTRQLFEFEGGELLRFERDKRLGSPSHWRQYFAYEAPTYAITDVEIDLLKDTAVTDNAAAAAQLRAIISRPHQSRGHYLDVLLDRLADRSMPFLPTELRGMALALADVLDDAAAQADEFKSFGKSDIWRRANVFFTRTDSKDFQEIVETARSINWLADFLRTQEVSARNRAHDALWLSQQEFSSAVNSLISRLGQITPDKLFKLPEPMAVLFLWMQHGDPNDVKGFLKNASRSNEGFISTLRLMRGWVNSSSTGVSHPVRESYVRLFMDAAKAKLRLQHLAAGKKARSDLQAQAKELLRDWEAEEVTAQT